MTTTRKEDHLLMNTVLHLYRILLVSLPPLFLFGCSATSLIRPSIAITIIPSAESASILETRAAKTQIINTQVPTPSPTLIFTLTPTPSPTLIPTMRAEAEQQEIARLMETNADCKGNCFWGISREETDFGQAVRLLSPLETVDLTSTEDGRNLFNNTYLYKNSQIGIELIFPEIKDKIEYLKVTVTGLEQKGVTGQDWYAFRPDNFLKAHHVPNQIKIIMSSAPEGRVSYGMVFLYDNMYIKYSGNQTLLNSSKVLHVCPNIDNSIKRFDLWIGQYGDTNPTWDTDLSQVTPYTPGTFFNLLTSDPKSGCFDLNYK